MLVRGVSQRFGFQGGRAQKTGKRKGAGGSGEVACASPIASCVVRGNGKEEDGGERRGAARGWGEAGDGRGMVDVHGDVLRGLVEANLEQTMYE